MGTTVFKRKIYNEILEWKKNWSDRYALLIMEIGETMDDDR